MRKTTIYGMMMLFLMSIVAATDCSYFDYESRIVTPSSPVYIVTDRASWTFSGLTYQPDSFFYTKCKIYAPSTSELREFKRWADFDTQNYKGSTVLVQTTGKRDEPKAVSFQETLIKGLVLDMPRNSGMNYVLISIDELIGNETIVPDGNVTLPVCQNVTTPAVVCERDIDGNLVDPLCIDTPETTVEVCA